MGIRPCPTACRVAIRLAMAALLLPSTGSLVPALGREITDPSALTSLQTAEPPEVSIEELFEAKDAFGAVYTGSGSQIVATANLDGRFNLWRFDASRSTPEKLAPSEDRQLNPVAIPGRNALVFESDIGGGELYDLFLLDLRTGERRNLTRTPDSSELGAIVSADGRFVAFSRRRETESNYDLVLLDLETADTRVVMEEDEPGFLLTPVEFTAQGDAILANRRDLQQSDGTMYLVPVDAAAPTAAASAIGPNGEGVYARASDLSDDGEKVAFFASQPGFLRRSGVLSLGSGRIEWLRDSEWPQGGGRFVPGSGDVVFEENASGRTTIFLFDEATGLAEALPLPPGNARFASTRQSPFLRDGSRLLLRDQAGNRPNEFWEYSLKTGALTRRSGLAPEALNDGRLPATRLVTYRSKDGTTISAFVWLPVNLDRDGSAPAVVMAHGGPTAQISDFFNRDAIALASRGFVVIAPNFRGSTGYGTEFQQANVGDLGGRDLDDLVAGAEFLVATGYVDPDRVGIMGGSYGGYLTVMGMARYPEIFSSGVNLYGVLDWNSLVESTEPVLQAYVRNLLGDPVENADQYARSSPSTYLDNLSGPLLILQGENDIRTPMSEAKGLEERLRAKGNVVEAIYYPEEGHGFSKKENQIDALRSIVDWFSRTL